jgi:membrane protein implicated in regulation of membrane protease activity
LTAAVGAVLVYFSHSEPAKWELVPFAIGMGMIAYSIAVAIYSLLAIWRIHRATKRETRQLQAQNQPPETRSFIVETYSRPPDQIG